MKSFDSDKYFRFSHSALAQLNGCARKFELARLYENPSYDRNQYDFAAEVGTAMHEGLQAFARDGNKELAILRMLSLYPHDLLSLQHRQDRDQWACVQTMDAAMEHEIFQESEVANVDQLPGTEVSFAIEFSNLVMADGRIPVYVGLIDLVMLRLVDQTFRAVDIKTHTNPNRNRDAEYRYNAQLVPYGLCISIMQEISLENLRFEVSYLDLCIDVCNPLIGEYAYSVDSERVQNWLVDFYMILQTVNKYLRASYWPQTMFGCTGFYGRACKYLDVCSETEPEVIQSQLLAGEMPEKRRQGFDAQYVVQMEAPEGILA